MLAGLARAQQVTPLSADQLARETVRVAAVQLTITPEDLEDGDAVDVLAPYMARAKEDGADLIVFPEYLFGNFHLDGPLVSRFLAAAREFDVNAIVGGWETLPGHEIQHPKVPGTYANTLVVASRKGQLLGTYRKTHAAVGDGSPYFWPPAPGELGENTMVLGEEYPVIDMDFGRVGLLTCYDGYFWPSFEIPSLRGAEILVWVNARGGVIEPHITQAASFMTCTHIVASNQGVGAGTQVVAYPANTQAIVTDPGNAYITAELNLAELRHQRRNNRMLHQRRPEIYQDLATEWRPWEAYPDIPFFEHANEHANEHTNEQMDE